MPNKTKNYNLIKPLPEEIYNIEDHNGNMDIIDEQLKKHSQELATAKSKIQKNENNIKSNTDAIRANTDIINDIKSTMNNQSNDNIAVITLDQSNWNSNKTQTVTVAGISDQEDKQIIHISPSLISLTNMSAYNNSCITAISCGNDSITFSAAIIPTCDISVIISYKNIDKI